MHILLAPDSFKESLAAEKVTLALKQGFERALPEASFDLMPLGDGGEGTGRILREALGLSVNSLPVTGPFGEPTDFPYASKEQLAVIEIADLVGLAGIPIEERHPLQIATQGLGELLIHLAQTGIQHVLIALGGSASHDGGLGLAAGLGYRFLDGEGQILPALGQSLGKIARLDKGQAQDLSAMTIEVLVDVTNPLCGSKGATYTFAGQKGLDQADFARVDAAMEDTYQLLNPSVISQPGAGAAGGLAAGLVTFAGARLVSGIDRVLDLLHFDERVVEADLVVVGEGKLDRQSLSGKAPIGVARRTPADTPVVAICGSLGRDLPSFPVENIQAAFSILPRLENKEQAFADTEENLIRTACNIGNVLRLKTTK